MGAVVQEPYLSKPEEPRKVAFANEMDADVLKMGVSLGTAAVRTCSDVKQFEVAGAHVSAGEGVLSPTSVALPEGRVHGGSLMAMLVGDSDLGSSNARGLANDSSEPINAYITPQNWI